MAALAGSITGSITVAWRIPSFIVSLGVLEMARGLAYQLTDSRTAYIGDAFAWLSNPLAFGISPSFIIALLVIVVAQLVLTRTVFGRYLIGIGTNEEAVRLAGIDPRPYTFLVFSLMGFNETIGGLVEGPGSAGGGGGQGVVQNGAATDSILTLNVATGQTYSMSHGENRNNKTVMQNGGAGKLNVIKTGPGTQVFGQGTFTYTGSTTVDLPLNFGSATVTLISKAEFFSGSSAFSAITMLPAAKLES